MTGEFAVSEGLSLIIMPEVATIQLHEAAMRAESLGELVATAPVLDDVTAPQAEQWLAQVVAEKRKLKDGYDEYVLPYSRELMRVQADWKTRRDPFDKLEAMLRAALRAYDQRKEAERREAERIAREAFAAAEAAREAETARLAEAVGVPVEAMPTLANADVQVVPSAPKSVETEHGKLSQRKTVDFQVIDIGKLPDRFVIKSADMAALRKEVLSSVEVVGLEKAQEVWTPRGVDVFERVDRVLKSR